jgi:2-polyprenyl-3-methyl-5-hydroxy-6-metoxy-1,4-benzoquinol methylase
MTDAQSDFPYNQSWIRYAWRRWLSGYYTGAPVIDYGCGIGVNGSILKTLGVHQVIGVDLDWGCLHESCRRGLSVVRGNLLNLPPVRSAMADIVMLIHVLEHFDDGALLLSSAADMIRPGGAIVVVTPDWSRNFVRFYDDPTHRRPYTRASLNSVLRGAGLRQRVLRQHNVGYKLGRTPLWRLFPRLCFTGDALFAIAERPTAIPS